ncbi:hypothetical protein ACFQ1I_15260 [Kitasatospora arboriphila]
MRDSTGPPCSWALRASTSGRPSRGGQILVTGGAGGVDCRAISSRWWTVSCGAPSGSPVRIAAASLPATERSTGWRRLTTWKLPGSTATGPPAAGSGGTLREPSRISSRRAARPAATVSTTACQSRPGRCTPPQRPAPTATPSSSPGPSGPPTCTTRVSSASCTARCKARWKPSGSSSPSQMCRRSRPTSAGSTRASASAARSRSAVYSCSSSTSPGAPREVVSSSTARERSGSGSAAGSGGSGTGGASSSTGRAAACSCCAPDAVSAGCVPATGLGQGEHRGSGDPEQPRGLRADQGEGPGVQQGQGAAAAVSTHAGKVPAPVRLASPIRPPTRISSSSAWCAVDRGRVCSSSSRTPGRNAK